MTGHRRAAVAGAFYPGDPSDLAAEVDGLLDAVDVSRTGPARHPVALIVPHAGYVYSGPVAASGYARLRHRPQPFRRVVVLGPTHFTSRATPIVPAADTWTTPLGRVSIDSELRRSVIEEGLAEAADAPHTGEHSIEVQLPFLQRIAADGWRLLPIGIGRIHPTGVARLVDRCGDDDTVLVVSTDLSHYLDYATASARDRETVAAILRRDPGAIHDEDACGAYALRGFLQSGFIDRLEPELLDLRNSGDTAGPHSRVVGYTSVAYTRSDLDAEA